MTTHVIKFSRVRAGNVTGGWGRRDLSLFLIPRSSIRHAGDRLSTAELSPGSGRSRCPRPPQVSPARPGPALSASRRSKTALRPRPGSRRCPGMASLPQPLVPLLLLLCGCLCPPARAGLYFREGQHCYKPAPRKAPGLRWAAGPWPSGWGALGKGWAGTAGARRVRGVRAGLRAQPGGAVTGHRGRSGHAAITWPRRTLAASLRNSVKPVGFLVFKKTPPRPALGDAGVASSSRPPAGPTPARTSTWTCRRCRRAGTGGTWMGWTTPAPLGTSTSPSTAGPAGPTAAPAPWQVRCARGGHCLLTCRPGSPLESVVFGKQV